MERIGDAARRLLSRLDARRAKERDRDRPSVVCRPAPPCSSDAQPVPDAGESITHKDRAIAPSVFGMRSRSAWPGGNEDGPSCLNVSRPSGAQVAANQNDPVHAGTLSCWP